MELSTSFSLRAPFTIRSIENSACKVPPHVKLVDSLDVLLENALRVIHLKEILKGMHQQLYHPCLLLHSLSEASEEVEVEVLMQLLNVELQDLDWVHMVIMVMDKP